MLLSPATNRRVAAPGFRRGATTVEFAVTSLVFFTLVLGIVEIGRALMVQHVLTDAARHGCRVGVLDGKATSDVSTAATAVLNAGGAGSATVTVQVNGVVADASTAQSGDEITVLTSVPAGQISWLPGLRYLTGNLTGQYTLRRE